MPVTKIEPQPAMAAWPHDRQRIGKAWTVSHPERPVGRNVRARKHPRQITNQELRALAGRSPLESAEFDGAGNSQSALHRGHKYLSVGRDDRPRHADPRRGNGDVITALALEWGGVAQAGEQLRGPCARANDDMIGGVGRVLAAD